MSRLFAAALAPLVCSSCVTSVRPLAYDFSDQPVDRALSETLDRLEATYAFTDWKAIDWADVRSRLLPAAEQAASDGDSEALDRALRALVPELPDGHVSLWNDDPERDLCPEAEGGLGIALSDTDDGPIVVTRVAPGSEAEAAGIAPGDALVGWGGLAVEDALEEAPLWCYPIGLATNERRRRARIHLLGRAEIGTEIELEFERDGAPHAAALAAHDDGGDVRDRLDVPAPSERVAWRMLSDDVGYIAIGWEDTILSERAFREALDAIWRDGARRLVLDLRGNDGGTDQTAANIVGAFTDREWFYETITMYDRRTEDQAVISRVYIEPQEIAWDLPVVALIDGATVSSGEGMAMMLARFGVEVVGFEGTAASFGSSGSSVALPGGWELIYPAGRSLDEAGEIQLDSDASLEGGVAPTQRIPWTAANRIAAAADPEGFAIDYAIERALGGL